MRDLESELSKLLPDLEPSQILEPTTVEDVLRLVMPKNAKVVAGASGLVHRVTWASTVRAMYPMFERLEGGELILLSLAELRNVDERLKLDYVAEKLSDAGVAALAVVGEVDSTAAEIGDKVSLPIIRLPQDAHIHELERTIISLVVNRRGELQSRAVAIYRRLTQVMLEGKGLAGIADELGRITGRRTQLFDRSLRPAHGDRREGLVSEGAETTILGTDRSMLSAMMANRPLITTSPPVVRLSDEATGEVCYAAAIVVRRRIEGYLTLWGKIGELGELERLAIGRGAAVSGIELSRQTSQRAATAAQDFLAGLLTGESADSPVVRRRALELGIDLAEPQVVALVTNAKGRQQSPDEAYASDLALWLFEDATRMGVAAWTVWRGYLALLPQVKSGDAPAGLRRWAESFQREAQERLGMSGVLVAIGDAWPGLPGLARSASESLESLEVGQKLFAGRGVLLFGKLGILRVLAKVDDVSYLADYYRQTLGGLVAEPGGAHNDLVATLKAFFACHGNVSQAAQMLYVHRNTLSYRLQRIHELTGLNLDDSEVALSLHLALRIGELPAVQSLLRSQGVSTG